MLAILTEGREKFYFDGVKAEFEAEGTRTDEFLRLLELARRARLKVGLKIGGAEAVRDLIESRQFGVDYIIAPMVETPYALSKYIEAKNKVYDADEAQSVSFLFNVETINTLRNIDEMAEIASQPGGCDGMVFGRVDFVGSLGIGRGAINESQVTRHIVEAAERARDTGLELVMGGGISSDAIGALREVRRTTLHRFETRKIIYDAAVLDGDHAVDALALAVEFEMLWLQNKREHYQRIADEDSKRLSMLSGRAAPVNEQRLASVG